MLFPQIESTSFHNKPIVIINIYISRNFIMYIVLTFT